MQEEGNKSSIKSSHMIIDSILHENEDTFCGEEPCDETAIREGISPNEMEMASSCLRRSQRIRRPSSILRDSSFKCNVSIESKNFEPSNLKEALLSPHKAKWEEAIHLELEAHQKNGTWELIKGSERQQTIGSKWVFKIKKGSNGTPIKYKARLVAQGFQQIAGIDFTETYAPTALIASIRIELIKACAQGWEIHQMDVKTTFLNGELNEEIYMTLPKMNKEEPTQTCRLKKSLYGLRQVGRCWYIRLHDFFLRNNFTCCKSDQSIYVLCNKDKHIIVAVYVDDMIIMANTFSATQYLKDILNAEFDMEHMGAISFCLWIDILYNQDKRVIHFSQQGYISQILERFHMASCYPTSTPMEGLSHLSDFHNKGDTVNFPYRSLIGSLMYASICTRLDISFATNKLSQFLENPSPTHWKAAKRILKYLKGTSDLGLTFQASSSDMRLHVDVDWASDPTDWKSFSGYCVFIGNVVALWEARNKIVWHYQQQRWNIWH